MHREICYVCPECGKARTEEERGRIVLKPCKEHETSHDIAIDDLENMVHQLVHLENAHEISNSELVKRLRRIENEAHALCDYIELEDL